VKPATFHILAALAGEARHGLGIVRDVLDQTDGELQLWPATLYGALEQLADEGLIEELGAHEHPAGESEKRRYYRLTRGGRAAMMAEVKRLEQLAAMARGRLTLGGAKSR
jgi:DNA-binding PadR family transcriptional regulator